MLSQNYSSQSNFFSSSYHAEKKPEKQTNKQKNPSRVACCWCHMGSFTACLCLLSMQSKQSIRSSSMSSRKMDMLPYLPSFIVLEIVGAAPLLRFDSQSVVGYWWSFQKTFKQCRRIQKEHAFFRTDHTLRQCCITFSQKLLNSQKIQYCFIVYTYHPAKITNFFFGKIVYSVTHLPTLEEYNRRR